VPTRGTIGARARVSDLQTIGRTVADAVWAAEDTGRPGAAKRRQVIRQVVSAIPIKGPCGPVFKAVLRVFVGALIECAVAAMNEARNRAT